MKTKGSKLKFIKLRECHICKPQVWKITKVKSVGKYKCSKCGTLIFNLLERRSRDDNRTNIEKMA